MHIVIAWRLKTTPISEVMTSNMIASFLFLYHNGFAPDSEASTFTPLCFPAVRARSYNKAHPLLRNKKGPKRGYKRELRTQDEMVKETKRIEGERQKHIEGRVKNLMKKKKNQGGGGGKKHNDGASVGKGRKQAKGKGGKGMKW